jgi:5-methylcytosine-specific restriction endonuclease McrA
VIVECRFCYNQFLKPKCHVARVMNVFCSKNCYDWFQEKKVEKHCVVCGDIFTIRPVESLKYSTCHKRKCRLTKKRRSNNGNWRGGVTRSRKAAMSTKRYKTWRLAVFERDNYICVECGRRGGNLNADHIKPWAYFPKLRYVVDNGRTLCVKCHRLTYKEVFKWRKVAT